MPTWRSTNRLPLLAATVVLAVVAGAIGASGAPAISAVELGLAVALLAAATTVALDDPARELLAAVPVGPARRLGRRVVVVVPALAASAAALLALGRSVDVAGVGAGSMAQVLAVLVAVGVLARAAVDLRRPDLATAAGVAVPVVWVLASTLVRPDGAAGTIAHAWSDHGWPLALTAGLLTVVVAARH